MTDPELYLWTRLRMDQIDGYRFRRQVPIGPYIVDFACFKAHLVVEVDGGQHAQARERDDRRTTWLASRGLRVLRFWDNDVLLQTDGVLDTIRAALRQRYKAESDSGPSDQGGPHSENKSDATVSWPGNSPRHQL